MSDDVIRAGLVFVLFLLYLVSGYAVIAGGAMIAVAVLLILIQIFGG